MVHVIMVTIKVTPNLIGVVLDELLLSFSDVTIDISGTRGFTYPLFYGIIAEYSM